MELAHVALTIVANALLMVFVKFVLKFLKVMESAVL
jgi:hypothetical protein